MSTAVFHRDALALFYARQHLKTDAGVKRVVYLPKNSPENQIRFIEVNDLISERGLRQLVPIDFGIAIGQSSFLSLLVNWKNFLNPTCGAKVCLPLPYTVALQAS